MMSGAEEAPEKPLGTGKNLGGRPSKFKLSMCVQVKKLAAIGATEKEIADFLDISESTLLNWKAQHPRFLRSLKAGKKQSDDRVEQSLFTRAIGHEYVSEVVITKKSDGTVTERRKNGYVAADTVAAIFWLKNRRKDKWRDVRSTQLTGNNDKPVAVEHKHTYGSPELLKDFYSAAQRTLSEPAVPGSSEDMGQDDEGRDLPEGD